MAHNPNFPYRQINKQEKAEMLRTINFFEKQKLKIKEKIESINTKEDTLKYKHLGDKFDSSGSY